MMDTFPSLEKVDFPLVNMPSSTSRGVWSIIQEKYKLNTTCCAQKSNLYECIF